MLYSKLMQNRQLPIALGIAIVLLLIPVTGQACPMCVESLKDSELGGGFNASILFLLVMPFALVGSIGGGLFFYARRHSRSPQGQRTYVPANSNVIGEQN